MARRILQGISLLALCLAGMVMLAAGAGSLAMWSGLKAVASESSEAWVSPCLIFASQLGITFSLAGSATLVLLRLRSWFQFEQEIARPTS